ncbi:hypothetical protein [Novosphingobium mangrovi (ex Huang et al. 2023)]|uniref:Alpha/beta hydrolase n=1 Tax=Novosphingobium mangrovi (ex Huang et al. 2023) TaxID=2976432 RepID=A0ABT2I2U9_9SPHN|nr:hypothetical protein [Novosphingobium mangrovi (ex Huang et al. 2023)]MCT2399123.1 hypothetical protein [Novosphingobium mangrovi (ex Huang et al. 2023)]
MRQIELAIDVSDAVGLGVPARIAASVFLPEPKDLPERPLVCVALPSSSYARGYYTCDLPGAGSGAQAAFHVARGWIVVALDWLGCDAASGLDPEDLGYAALTTAAHAAQAEILLRLANGVLEPGYPPVGRPCVIGIGQSLGGGLLIYQQARHGSFDGIGVLGFSAIHAHPATPPGGEPVVVAWYPRDASLEDCREPLNAAALSGAQAAQQKAAWEAVAWGFHYDDVPADVVEQDLIHYEGIARGIDADAPLPPWYARRTPQRAARSSLTPGVVAAEAAAVTVPVLAAMGVRDLVPDPRSEPRAYSSARSVDVFVCPRMGHMHNMAGTRALLWERIHLFGQWCAALKGQE